MRGFAKACWMAGAAVLGVGLAGAPASADGYPPFYGYSDYFGGPKVYFTPDDTIRQVTKTPSVEHSLGTRTYYRGGPFWTYGTDLRRPTYASRERPDRRRRVLRRRY